MSDTTPTTRAEHYRRAEQLLSYAEQVGDGYTYTESGVQAGRNRTRAANDIAAANVHALLALASPAVAGEQGQGA